MADGSHPAKPAASRVGAAGATKSKLTPARVAQRAQSAETLATVLRALVASGEKGATKRAAARRAGISHEQMNRLCDPLSGRGLLLDLLHALGPKVAAAMLRAELARIEVRGIGDLRDAALDVQTAAGRLADRVRGAHADGVVTLDEIDQIEGAAHGAQAAAAATLATCAAARRALR